MRTGHAIATCVALLLAVTVLRLAVANPFEAVGALVGLQSEQLRRLLRERERLVLELEASARRDQLTGLPNRRAWDERFAGRAQTGRPLGWSALSRDCRP